MGMTSTALSPVTNYTLSVTAADGTTTKQNLGKGSTFRLVASTDMFVQFKVGSAPTAATTTDMFLPANSPEYFHIDNGAWRGVTQGDVYLSGIVASGTGTLYATVMG